MKKKILLSIIFSVFIIALIGIVAKLYLNSKGSEETFSIWWWDNRIDTTTYLDFAEDNNINEIYYYSSSLDDKTNLFIEQANSKNIKVYWLIGEYEWIEDNDSLEKKFATYITYQNEYKNKFEGIHIDIEPHQHPEFDLRRQELITKYVELVIALKYKYKDIKLEYDIPFWLDDKVTIDNITKPAYEFVIDNSSKVTVMSYRDSAEKIYDVAKEEIEYAKVNNKTLNLSVETSQNEDDIVTFYEEGKDYMMNELSKLRDMIPKNFGIAIHHIKSFYELK